MIHFRVRFERLAEHLARSRRRADLWRAAWLALLVPCIGAAGTALGLWHWTPWAWLLAAGLAFAAAAWSGARPATGQPLGRWLDRRFHLDELIVTAIEVDRRGPRGPIETRLLDDAAMAVAQLDRGPGADPRPVRREKETALAVGLLLAGLWLLAASSTAAGADVARLPALAADGDTGSSGGNGPGSGAEGGNGVAPGWSGMASALGDHAAALGLAAALDRGDAAGAARAARALADQAPALSPAGRSELAEAVRQAATAAPDPSLRAALDAAAQALAAPNTRAAADAVERLAAAFDARAAAPGAGLAMATPSGASRPGPAAERLAAGGTPQTLGTAAPGRPAGPGSRRADGPAAGSAAPAAAAPVQGAAPPYVGPARSADALVVPRAYRDMVRRYFAREGKTP